MKILAFSLLLAVVLSCNNNTVPDGILPENKMRTLLWDILRADEWVNYEAGIDTSLNKSERSKDLYERVYQVNNVTAAQFKKSFEYYQSRPDLLKPLLDSLQKRGSLIPAAAIQ